MGDTDKVLPRQTKAFGRSKQAKTLAEFLDIACKDLMPKLNNLKRGRSDEVHWITGDDRTIHHEGRIDSGGCADVYQVESPSYIS